MVGNFSFEPDRALSSRPPSFDVVFVVDNSHPDFLRLSKQVITSLLDYFSISPSTTRVSLFTISDEVTLKFHFKSFVNRECVVKAVNRLNESILPATLKSLVKATLKTRKLFATYPRGDRVKLAIHLLTNSRRYSPKYAYVYNDITSYAVVYGQPNDKVEYLVTPLKSKHLFFVRKNSDVKAVVNTFEFKKSYMECSGTGTVRDECDRVCECVHGKLTNCYRLRKELSKLSNAERKRLFTAIYKMGMSSKYKTTHDKFVWVHENYMCTTIHNEDYFNPWHRWYIVLFENTLREMDCRITVPFWDWSYWMERKDLFNTKHIWRPYPYDLGGDGNLGRSMCISTGQFREDKWFGFKHEKTKEIIKKTAKSFSKADKRKFKSPKFLTKKRCLRRKFSPAGDIKPLPSLDKMLGVPLNQFRDIMLYLRYRIHGSVHMAVGGTMSSSWSADVPEFWLHHTFLDKIWWLWQERGKEFKNVYYSKLNNNMFLWPYTQKQIIDTMNLPKCIKYKYDGWPQHNIVPFYGLNTSSFAGNYLEKSVCDGNELFENYQDHMSSVFPDKDMDDAEDDDGNGAEDDDDNNDEARNDEDEYRGVVNHPRMTRMARKALLQGIVTLASGE